MKDGEILGSLGLLERTVWTPEDINIVSKMGYAKLYYIKNKQHDVKN